MCAFNMSLDICLTECSKVYIVFLFVEYDGTEQPHARNLKKILLKIKIFTFKT